MLNTKENACSNIVNGIVLVYGAKRVLKPKYLHILYYIVPYLYTFSPNQIYFKFSDLELRILFYLFKKHIALALL